MRTRLKSLIPALVSVLFLLPAGCGQQQPAAGTTSQFNPRDLSGFWLRERPDPNEHPPFTPAGQAMMKGRLPDHLVRVPTDGNDPMYKCNPQGFPRLVWDENEPLEIIHLDGRILQLFQWERTLRELWMDGRALPSGENLDNIGPNWYGHSVAEWQGNTLVVKTTGLNEKAWLDVYGNPQGFDAIVEERYTRTGADTIEGEMTFTDPKNYTAPWKFPKSVFNRMKPEDVSFFGWKGLFSGVTDGICAPINEVDEYNKKIRDPAIFGIKK